MHEGEYIKMIYLVELCIKGDLHFFENTFSDQELDKVKHIANTYFLKEQACIPGFVDEVRKKLSLNVTMAEIKEVIAL